MKKTAFAILIILAFSLISYAGSIDVELLYEDEAMVFVGRIDDFAVTYEEKNYPNTIYNVTLTPTLKLKGNVILDEALVFEEVSTGNLKLEKEKEYFCGKLSETLYIWELDSYENLFDWEKDDYKENDLILKERHNDSIAGGIQKYLNDRSFHEAEKKRAEKATLGEITVSTFLKTDATNVKSVTLSLKEKSYALDKELFMKIAEKTVMTPVKNGNNLDFDGIYLTVENKEGFSSFLYITPEGSADSYSQMFSKLPCEQYRLDISFLKQLYAISPKEAQENFPEFNPMNRKVNILYLSVIFVFVFALIAGYIFSKKRGKTK